MRRDCITRLCNERRHRDLAFAGRVNVSDSCESINRMASIDGSGRSAAVEKTGQELSLTLLYTLVGYDWLGSDCGLGPPHLKRLEKEGRPTHHDHSIETEEKLRLIEDICYHVVNSSSGKP